MDTDTLLGAIKTLPDPQHPSTQIAQRAAFEIKRLRDENEWLRAQLPSTPEAAAMGGGFDPYNP